jgi:hypothetical protein
MATTALSRASSREGEQAAGQHRDWRDLLEQARHAHGMA